MNFSELSDMEKTALAKIAQKRVGLVEGAMDVPGKIVRGVAARGIWGAGRAVAGTGKAVGKGLWELGKKSPLKVIPKPIRYGVGIPLVFETGRELFAKPQRVRFGETGAVSAIVK